MEAYNKELCDKRYYASVTADVSCSQDCNMLCPYKVESPCIACGKTRWNPLVLPVASRVEKVRHANIVWYIKYGIKTNREVGHRNERGI